MTHTLDKWIGLAEVVPREGNSALEPLAAGAFVIVVGLAENQSDFEQKVLDQLDLLQFDMLELSDAEIYSLRASKGTIDQPIRELADTLSPETSVQFDIFCKNPFE